MLWLVLSLLSTVTFAETEPPKPIGSEEEAYVVQRRILADSYTPTPEQLKSGKIKIAVFDADSTLRLAPSGNVSANNGRDVWLLPLVTKRIAELNAEGYLVLIASNQAGIPKYISLKQSDSALDFVRRMAAWLNPSAVFHYYDFAENNDNDRKPNTGMLDRLEAKLKAKYGDKVVIDKANSFMCGDSAYKKTDTRPDGKPGTDFSNSDRGLAEKYGIRFSDPADEFGWRQYGIERFMNKKMIDQFFVDHPELKGKPVGRCPFPSLVPPEAKYYGP